MKEERGKGEEGGGRKEGRGKISKVKIEELDK